jgi:chromosome segregation ATPase
MVMIQSSSMVARMQEELKSKQKAKEPLFAQRKRIKDQTDIANAEIKAHKAAFEAKYQESQGHVNVKNQAQDRRIALAAKLRKQRKKLENLIDEASLEQEFPDQLTRAVARAARRRQQSNSESGSDSDDNGSDSIDQGDPDDGASNSDTQTDGGDEDGAYGGDGGSKRSTKKQKIRITKGRSSHRLC